MVQTTKASNECLCVARDEPLDGRRTAIVKKEVRDLNATLSNIKKVDVRCFAIVNIKLSFRKITAKNYYLFKEFN